MCSFLVHLHVPTYVRTYVRKYVRESWISGLGTKGDYLLTGGGLGQLRRRLCSHPAEIHNKSFKSDYRVREPCLYYILLKQQWIIIDI